MQSVQVKKRLKGLMITRLCFVSLILGVFCIISIILEQKTFLHDVLNYRKDAMFYAVALFYSFTIIYALISTKWGNYLAQIHIQILIDILLCLGIVHFSGGIDSIFVFLPIIPIIAASIILSRREVYEFTSICCLFYISYVIFVQKGSETPYESLYLFYVLYTRITIFMLIGYLGGYLSKRLQEGEMEVSKLRRLNQIVLAQMRSGLIIADETDSIIYINNAGEAVLSVSSESILGEKWHKYFLGEKNYDEEIVAKYKTKRDFETVITSGNNENIPLGFNITDITEEKEGGQIVVGKAIIFKDLTEIKQMEFRMRQADKLSAVGSLAAGVAHEIRNPLSAISGAVEVLKEKNTFEGEDEQELIEVILTETDRLNGIIKNFLNYTKVRPLEITYFDINKIFYEIITLITKGNILKENISLLYKNKDKKFFIEADVDQIKQVFFNLVINAIEAMINIGGILTIDLVDDLDFLTITVTDTGCGIAVSRLKKVFEPFHSSKESGIGVGLSIVKNIIEAHKGEIEVASTQDKGTTFSVRLPKKQDKLANLNQRIKQI